MIPVCTLLTHVPFLADVPNDWHVNLVDTPGFVEFDRHVEFLATEAQKSSSAYVYVTTYDNLWAQPSADYLRFIFAHDQGTLYCPANPYMYVRKKSLGSQIMHHTIACCIIQILCGPDF